MKKIFIIVATVIILLAIGYLSLESNKPIKADGITVFYGCSSYAMSGADQSIIDDLLRQFNSLRFEKTTDKVDLSTAFMVNFSFKGRGVRSFWVDENSVFWLDGKTQCYKVSSGSFDYEHLRTIYNDSKHIKPKSIRW